MLISSLHPLTGRLVQAHEIATAPLGAEAHPELLARLEAADGRVGRLLDVADETDGRTERYCPLEQWNLMGWPRAILALVGPSRDLPLVYPSDVSDPLNADGAAAREALLERWGVEFAPSDELFSLQAVSAVTAGAWALLDTCWRGPECMCGTGS